MIRCAWTGTGYDDEDEGEFDDLPETHLDDDEYGEFLKREFDGEGRPKGTPPVTWILLLLIVVVLALAVVSLRG